MSLHQKSRDYLFREFISRNYKGISEPVKRELMKIRPDEIIKFKNEKTVLERLQEKLNQYISGLEGKSPAQAAASVISILSDVLKLDYVLIYEYHQPDDAVALIASKGRISRGYKTIKFSDIGIKKFIKEISLQFKDIRNISVRNSPITFEIFPNLNNPVCFPIVNKNSIYGFAVVGEKGDTIAYSNGFFSFIRNLLLLLADIYRTRGTEDSRQTARQKAEKLNRFYKNACTALIGEVKPEAQTVTAMMKAIKVGRLMLLEQIKGGFKVAAGYGFARDIKGKKLSSVKGMAKNGLLGTEGLKELNSNFKSKSARIKNAYAYSPKRAGGQVLCILDPGAASAKDSLMLETYAVNLYNIINAMSAATGTGRPKP